MLRSVSEKDVSMQHPVAFYFALDNKMPSMDWGNWNVRLKAKKKESHKTDADLAAAVFGDKKKDDDDSDGGRAAVNHWLNKRRPITLEAFFTICTELGADPGEILFGMPMVPKIRGVHTELAAALEMKGHPLRADGPPKSRAFKAKRIKVRVR